MNSKRFTAVLLSAVLTIGLCLPAAAVEQPEVQAEEAGAEAMADEQEAEISSEENDGENNIVEEDGSSGETEVSDGTEASDDEIADTADGQAKDAGDTGAFEDASEADTEEAAEAEVPAETDETGKSSLSGSAEDENLRDSGETSDWLANYDYSIVDNDVIGTCVALLSYNGADLDIIVPGTAQVEGVTYPVTAGAASNLSSSSAESITLGDGFMLPESCSYFFAYNSSLVSVDISGADASHVTSMTGMFSWCSSLQDVNFGSIDVSNVTYVNQMFYECSSLEEIDLTCFSAAGSIADSVSYLFYDCGNLRRANLEGWNWSNIYYASDVFDGCDSLEELVTPAYSQYWFELPVCMADDSGNIYSGFGNSESLRLHAAEVSEWLEEYAFTLLEGENTIILQEYRGSDSEIAAPATAYIEGTEYGVAISDSPWRSGVTSLSFEAGFQIINWSSRCFAGMSDLETLDLRNVDFSRAWTLDGMVEDDDNLQLLYVPANIGHSFDLPIPFTDENGTLYTEVPGDLPYDVILRSASVSEWLKGYRYSISDDEIVLETYREGSPEAPRDVVVQSSAVIDDREFSKVTFNKYCWKGYSTTSVSFETGVIIPADLSEAFSMRYQDSLLESVDFGNIEGAPITNAEAMFVQCKKLADLDLSGLDFSQCSSTENMLTGCESLQTIATPVGVISEIKLPGAFTDSEGNMYTEIPRNLDHSITLTKVEASDWLSNYEYKLSDDRIILTDVKHKWDMEYGPGGGSAVSGVVTVQGSATVGTTDYDIIELTSGMWGDVYLSELYLEQGVVLPADCDGMFENTSVEKIDLSQTDVSNVENADDMFKECSSLTTIITPVNAAFDAGLPGAFADDSGKIYSKLPRNLSESITLTKTVLEDNWLGEYEFYISGDKVVLTKYNGSDTGIVLPGSAEIGDTTYNIIEIGRYLYTSERPMEQSAITSISFERGVRFPDDSSGLFNYMDSLTSLDLSNIDTSNVTNMSEMFLMCSNLTSLNISGFDTSNVTDMGYMFNGCSNLTSLDLSGFDTSRVTDMGGMFGYCTNLTSLDLSGFDTSNVTDMYDMFEGCENLTSLDVSGFDTSNVTDMSYMFSRCKKLASLDVSDFNTQNVGYIRYMFYGCDSLLELDLSSWDLSSLKTKGSHTFSGKTPVIRTPVNVPVRVELWGVYAGSDGNTYDLLPTDTGTSILLTWLSISGDPDESGDPSESGDPDESGDPAQDRIRIITQPQDTEAKDGEQASFTVEAEGDGLSYQWQWSADGTTWKNCTSSSYNTETFSFKMKASAAGRQYRCVITSGSETLTSDAAYLYLKSSGEFTVQPEDVEAAAGETAEFHVEFSGEDASYQWQYSTNGTTWKNCTSGGYNTDTFSFTMKATAAGRLYRCVVTANGETYTSDSALLSLPSELEIIVQPEDVEAAAGETVTFHVEANREDVTYQWQYSTNGTWWRDCTSGSYNTDTFSFRMKESVSGRQYRCQVSDGEQAVVSQGATVTLAEGLMITQNPSDVEAAAGETVVFHVETNKTDVTYQWQWSSNGTTWKNCSSGGYNTDTFSFKMKESVSGRRYRCEVSNGARTVTSKAAVITLAEEGFMITQNPSDVQAAVGERVEFHVETNRPDATYQWQWSSNGTSWKNCTSGGFNTETFSFTMKATVSGRMYRCRVTSGAESINSEPAVITLAD